MTLSVTRELIHINIIFSQVILSAVTFEWHHPQVRLSSESAERWMRDFRRQMRDCASWVVAHSHTRGMMLLLLSLKVTMMLHSCAILAQDWFDAVTIMLHKYESFNEKSHEIYGSAIKDKTFLIWSFMNKYPNGDASFSHKAVWQLVNINSRTCWHFVTTQISTNSNVGSHFKSGQKREIHKR